MKRFLLFLYLLSFTCSFYAFGKNDFSSRQERYLKRIKETRLKLHNQFRYQEADDEESCQEYHFSTIDDHILTLADYFDTVIDLSSSMIRRSRNQKRKSWNSRFANS